MRKKKVKSINSLFKSDHKRSKNLSIEIGDLFLDYSKNLHGLNRIGKPENFIPLINALIDKQSDWITGQTFNIDGGLSNVK